MKQIENKITVGAPHSLARYQNAHRICADCLDKASYVLGRTQHPCGEWMPATEPYKALSVGNGFASYDGTCYVCEKPAHVAVVEFNLPLADKDRDGAIGMCAELGID